MLINHEEDFKYVMQDIERYYFGARLSYAELDANELTPFKFKTICEKYLGKELDPSTALESQLYFLDKETFEYRVLHQLRAKVRVSQQKKSRHSSSSPIYEEKVYKIEQLVNISPADKQEAGMIVRELIISKLALFGFSV